MSNSLSRRTVTCYDCNEDISSLYNLKIHYERQHPGKQCRQKGQSLLNFSTASKRKHDGDRAESNDSMLSKPAENEPTGGASSISSLDNSFTQCLSKPQSVDSSLLEQMQSILDALKSQLGGSISNQNENPKCECDPELADRIQICAALKEIQAVLGEDYTIDRVNEILICKLCVPIPANITTERTQNTPGIIKIQEVENTKQKVQSRELRNLKTHLIHHLKTDTHKINTEKQHEQLNATTRIRARNRDIGRKIGSLAYFFLYYKLPYRLFEKFMPMLSLNDIDIGQINHSEIFLRKLLNPCFEVLQRRLRTYLDQLLPCTGRQRAITLLLDKGTIKHDTTQLTLLRTPCLRNGVLFESFFVGNPNVVNNCGLALTKLLLDTVTETLSWNGGELRERLSGVCVDGQYIHLNIIDHVSDLLLLPKNLVIDFVIWDAAHRLELACKYAKEGTKVGENVIGDTRWLLELDNVLQHIMKKFRFGHNHTELQNIAKELNEKFLEFNLFSETRFIEYAHRTYDHFLRMYRVLFEKLKRDEDNATKEKDEEESESIQNLLVQLELVVNLLFMADISHLITFCSKEFQRFDVLPFHAMNMYFELKQNLHLARNSFCSSTVPRPIHLHKTEHQNSYSVWQSFGNCVNLIIETQAFQNVRLLVRTERGRVTRSGTIFCSDKEGFRSIILQKYKNYMTYIDSLIRYLEQYFEPWPEWVVLCNNSFNFRNDLEIADRKESFKQLMDMPHGINTLLADEKLRLMSEYLTLYTNAMEVSKELSGDGFKIEQLWYILLTKENYYNNCKFINHFALQFFNRSFNECIVESEVSSVEAIQTSERPLKDENAEKLNFISSNGPHPLVSMSLVEDMLTRHFGKDWHFTLNDSKWFVSKIVDRHFQTAKNNPNSLA